MRKHLIFIIPVLLGLATCSPVEKKKQVRIEKTEQAWQLLVHDTAFIVKGVVGDSYLDTVKKFGGNSVRTGWKKEDLDRITGMGLYALVNLPADAERYGMDYNDTAAVRKQHDSLMGIVRSVKDHPAVLMWAIGNELDYIPGTLPFNPLVWDAVNSLARSIHETDPDHPVMTVIGTSMMKKVADIVARCPDLDLLGINSYGDIFTLGDTLIHYGWTRPYIITEWGPSGYWEVRKAPWGAPFEQTGREKLDCYRDKYLKAIAGNQGQCLGSYVFYWKGSKQETTHTWFCLFDRQGNKTPMADLMRSLWNGTPERQDVPVLDSLQVNNIPASLPVFLAPGRMYAARAFFSPSADTSLTFAWEIRPEAKYAAYAGQGEIEPQPLPGLEHVTDPGLRFRAPAEKGPYRLFVYVYNGRGNFSTANLPFYVRQE